MATDFRVPGSEQRPASAWLEPRRAHPASHLEEVKLHSISFVFLKGVLQQCMFFSSHSHSLLAAKAGQDEDDD